MEYFNRALADFSLSEPPCVIAGDEALNNLLDEQELTGKKVMLIADPDTARAVSAFTPELLDGSVGSVRMLPAEPVPGIELVEQIADEITRSGTELIIAVGSGVISDIAKHASFTAGIANWCCVTAASVDAFTSGTAAIRVAGYHTSLKTRPAERIYCDYRVMKNAPLRMTLSGLGDLTGKFIAAADWKLSSVVTDEEFSQKAADFAEGSARLALKRLPELKSGSDTWVPDLTDAVLTSGFIMRVMNSSRPASSAEHILAHYWDMENLVTQRYWDLHGALVAVAARIIAGVYRQLVPLCAKKTPTIERRELTRIEDKQAYSGVSVSDRTARKMQEEIALRDLSRDATVARQRTLLEVRHELPKIYTRSLEEAEEAFAHLKAAGLPLSPKELGISRTEGLTGLLNIPFLRCRYTLIDAARDLGFDRECREIMEEVYDAL